MSRKLQTVTLFPLLFSLLVAVQGNADTTTAEFRHLTKEDGASNFTYYGCQTCTLPFLPLPPSNTWVAGSPPAADYTLTTDIINSQPFEFGGQAGLAVNIDETNLPVGADSWSRSEAHVETAVEFADVAIVQGLNGVPSGTISFTWILDGEHSMTLDPTPNVGTGQVHLDQAFTLAELSMDHLAMGIPSQPTLFSAIPNPNTGFPSPTLNSPYSIGEPASFGQMTFQGVPFTAGDNVVVEFDLLVAADLAVDFPDTPLFSATMDSLFQNTATLESVEIFDATGNVIDGATLVSTLGRGTYPMDGGPGPDPVLDILIDIKPGSETNTFNNNGHGVIPVAILGSEDFDVTQIDLDTVEMDTLSIKVAGKSNKLLASLQDTNGDSFLDYVVKIEDTDVVYELGDDIATLTGSLLSGQLFEGVDSISIVPNSQNTVPEPNSFVLSALLIGGCVAGNARRRRRIA